MVYKYSLTPRVFKIDIFHGLKLEIKALKARNQKKKSESIIPKSVIRIQNIMK